MRGFLALFLAACAATSARAASQASLGKTAAAAAARLSAAPTLPTAPGAAGLAPTLPLMPLGADLRLDPSVQATMSNPVPITATGLDPSYFKLDQQPQAASADAAPAAALASGRALAASAAPSAGAAVENATARVYDGDRRPAEDAAETPALPAAAPDVLSRARRLKGKALLEELHEITGPRAGFKPLGYASAQNALFSSVDRVKVKGRVGVRDAYSGELIEDRAKMSVEHVWPQSLYGGGAPMRNDLHGLLPVSAEANGMRGDLPFGVVRGKPEWSNAAGAKRGGGVFEPPNEEKGRVARAMLYMYLRYYDRGLVRTEAKRAFWNRQLPTLLEWNRRYPPTEQEKRRNAMAKVEQGNGNPLIDMPSLADSIGEKAFRR